MEAFAVSLEAMALADWLRFSRWGYAAVNASHLLGLSLLIGAGVALDLRLLGLWRTVDLQPLYRVLSRVAATGLGLAVITGLLLFIVRASEYIELDLFFIKIGLITAGTIFAVALSLRSELWQLSRSQQRVVGLVSLLTWLAVLVCGRLLAFV